MSTTMTADETREWLRGRLSELLGDDATAIDRDADLTDYGLDSVRLFELVPMLREVRADVEFADVAEDRSIAALERLLGAGDGSGDRA
ncbi:MAG: phosphopantetheine-binding protein [Pseudoclavibacter sp.]